MAQIGRKNGVLRANGTHVGEELLPRYLARVRRGKAPLKECSSLSKLELICGGKVLRRELGVRYYDIVYALFAGSIDHGKDLVTAKVTGG